MFIRYFTFFVFLCTTATYSQESSIDTAETELSGAINIVSTPSDADIYINGKKAEHKTPALLADLKVGLNTIEVSLPDYLFAKRQVTILPDTTISISFKLISLSDTAHILGDLKLGILRLPGPPINAPYLVDNKQVYSREFTLNTGKHHIVWEGGNVYSSLDTIVEIFPGKLTTFNFIPERLTGKLTISPFPRDAEIYINERLYSTGDLDIVLSTGNYRVLIKRNGYFPQERNIVIHPGKHIYLEIDLDIIPDRDKDGFLDSVDLCPDEYGLYCGCPEQDRRDAIQRYKKILLSNLKNQPLTISVTAVGYIYRNPTNPNFRHFLSNFNDGKIFCNNRNGLTFANNYTVSYHGFFLSCELGQWLSGLEYKKGRQNPVIIETEKDQYCIFYKDSITGLNPRVVLPGTAVSLGFNLHIINFNAAYSLGYQWENIIITDLITKSNYDKHKALSDSLHMSIPYTGPRTEITFDNSHWFHKLRFEYDITTIKRVIPAFYITAALSFGSDNQTGWHTFQAGILFKFLATPKRKGNRKIDTQEGSDDNATNKE